MASTTKYPIPDLFSSRSEFSLFWKYSPAIFVGKNKLPFPVNVNNLQLTSLFFSSLLETDISDTKSLSEVCILSDYDITYENTPFFYVWIASNIFKKDEKYGFLATSVPIINNMRENPQLLMEARLYCNYLGNKSILGMIDRNLLQFTEENLSIFPEIKQEILSIQKTFKLQHLKRNIQRHLKSSLENKMLTYNTNKLFELCKDIITDPEYTTFLNRIKPNFKSVFSTILKNRLYTISVKRRKFLEIEVQMYEWLERNDNEDTTVPALN